MRPMGDARDHFWLVMRMTKTIGVDLGAAMREGRLSTKDYAATITRCRGCENPQGCRAWLAQTTTADAPPDFCRNAPLFDLLERV